MSTIMNRIVNKSIIPRKFCSSVIQNEVKEFNEKTLQHGQIINLLKKQENILTEDTAKLLKEHNLNNTKYKGAVIFMCVIGTMGSILSVTASITQIRISNSDKKEKFKINYN